MKSIGRVHCALVAISAGLSLAAPAFAEGRRMRLHASLGLQSLSLGEAGDDLLAGADLLRARGYEVDWSARLQGVTAGAELGITLNNEVSFAVAAEFYPDSTNNTYHGLLLGPCNNSLYALPCYAVVLVDNVETRIQDYSVNLTWSPWTPNVFVGAEAGWSHVEVIHSYNFGDRDNPEPAIAGSGTLKGNGVLFGPFVGAQMNWVRVKLGYRVRNYGQLTGSISDPGVSMWPSVSDRTTMDHGLDGLYATFGFGFTFGV